MHVEQANAVKGMELGMEQMGNTGTTEQKRAAGINASALKMWGMLFILAGVISRSILQNGFLGVGSVTGQELMEAMQASDSAMVMATAALLLQALETCAVPIFAFTLVEGFRHTKDWKKYLIRLAGLALFSEIPYNLAYGQQVLELSSRNPVFGLVLGLILLCLYQQFAGKKAVCVIAAMAAAAWSLMLKVEHGIPMLLIVSVLWIFREKAMIRGFMGAAAAAACTVGSLFYLASPMGFLAIHCYNGENGDGNRLIGYLFYPITLLAVGLAGMLLV